jgi:hypothetical protein
LKKINSKKDTMTIEALKDFIAIPTIADDKDAIELSHQYDTLASRTYDDGGLVDLEAGYGKTQTPEQLNSYLTSVGTDDDDHDSDDDHDGVSSTSKPAACQ